MGRIAARRALRRLGEPGSPVLPAADRSPRWPKGVVGSITHCSGYAAAAVAREADCLALGVDVEAVRTLHHDITSHIADETEQLWVDSDPTRMLALFSAKEAVFKAFYRFKQAYFGFEAVHLDKTAGGFGAILRMPLGPFAEGYRFTVHAGVSRQCVWSAVCLPADAPQQQSR